jgi:hypothetical protein
METHFGRHMLKANKNYLLGFWFRPADKLAARNVSVI